MLCGLTRIVSRIKWAIFFSFDREKRPFEKSLCHSCLTCPYFDDCVSDQKIIEEELGYCEADIRALRAYIQEKNN